MITTLFFDDVYLYGVSTVTGIKEKEGPLGELFDYSFNTKLGGEDTFELFEAKMIKMALEIVLNKTHLNIKDIEISIGGDLTNQIVSSNIAFKNLDTSFIGVYGACSTSMLSLLVGASFVSMNLTKNALTFASSNFYAAERQFRYPVEYGVNKKETATVTTTGASCALVSNKKSKIKIVSATIGKVIDLDWTDTNDMGSVMAYAAHDTIINHLKNTKTTLDDYSLILTGDLSNLGSKVLKDLFILNNNPINNHMDAGCMIYDKQNQKDVFCGGSGCACLPLVGYTLILNELLNNKYERVLFVGTGCLHSKGSSAQKQSIPVIAHAVEIRRI